ncbi:aspartate aminotransferase family protein [Aestuariivirga sp.]|uniref:aspartate aminotransferase family protein n=1 Tax=Aestuariivirga sp. TaxID=2650926 RepID=UPI0039E72B6C
MQASKAAGKRNMDLAAAVGEAEQRYAAQNPKSLALAKSAAAHMPGGNTRTTVHYSPFPLYFSSGANSRVTDSDGHSYADFVNEFTAGVFGHSNAVIADSIRETLAGGINLGGCTAHEIALSEEVRKRFPAMELMRFCNSGTEANLLALATARAFTGKPAVLVFDGAYHGSIIYFVSGASPLNMTFDWIFTPFNDLERAAAAIAENAHKLAAVIVEPMQGGAGAIPAAPGFIAGLRAACDENKVLLVLDEVMTSRVGYGGLQGKLGVSPDLTTLGKYVGGGLTIGAFGGRADIMEKFDPSRPGAYPHGGTFNNNVLAMAAGHAGLTKVLSRQRVEAMNDLGDVLIGKLSAVAGKHRLPVQITGQGSIFGIHFSAGPVHSVADQLRAEKGREASVADLKKLFHLEMLANSFYVARRISGNLSIETTAAEVDGLCEAFDTFLSVHGGLIRDVMA